MPTDDPYEHHTHKRTFEAGFGETGFESFRDLIHANMERLANRVERPCTVVVSIEVYDEPDYTEDTGSDRDA